MNAHNLPYIPKEDLNFEVPTIVEITGTGIGLGIDLRKDMARFLATCK